MSEDSIVINFHDAVLYQSDLKLLCDGNWLNDSCINYGITRLAVQGQSSLFNLQYIDPSVVSFFMHQLTPGEDDDDDEMMSLYNNWNITSSEKNKMPTILFVPINDNNAVGFGSGSQNNVYDGNHWSLLVAIINNGNLTSFHLDSSSNYNGIASSRVHKRLGYIVELGSSGKIKKCECTIECETPQQKNGYDCGIHCLVAAEAISRMLWHAPKATLELFQNNDVSRIKNTLEDSTKSFVNSFKNDGDEIGVVARKRLLKSIETIS